MPKKISELQSAELRFRALLNKRDEINEQAAVIKSERDSLNEKKRELQDQMNDARDRRDELVKKMRAHKSKRDGFQAKARELLEFKKSLKGRQVGSLKQEIHAQEAEVRMLELRQQTVPLTIPKERELLESIKSKSAEVQRLRKVLVEQDKIEKEVKDLDASINALFRQADKEHAEVVKYSDEQHKAHEEASALYKEVASLAATANKKHDEFMKLREEANAAHEKASDMREKIIGIRREKRMERMEEMKAIRDVNISARKALDDKVKKDKAADDALAMLLKKGKIQIS